MKARLLFIFDEFNEFNKLACAVAALLSIGYVYMYTNNGADLVSNILEACTKLEQNRGGERERKNGKIMKRNHSS